jgi:hypothetical protein
LTQALSCGSLSLHGLSQSAATGREQQQHFVSVHQLIPVPNQPSVRHKVKLLLQNRANLCAVLLFIYLFIYLSIYLFVHLLPDMFRQVTVPLSRGLYQNSISRAGM